MSLEASGSAHGSDLECVLVHCVQVGNKRVCVCIYRHAHMQLQLSCTSVCECEYVHVTSCVCERLGDVCSCAPVCACLRPCTLLWDSMAMCAAPGPRLSVSAVTSSELSSSRPGTPAYPGPTDKSPRGRFWCNSLCKEDLNLPELLGAALETVAWLPVGGNRRIDHLNWSLEKLSGDKSF